MAELRDKGTSSERGSSPSRGAPRDARRGWLAALAGALLLAPIADAQDDPASTSGPSTSVEAASAEPADVNIEPAPASTKPVKPRPPRRPSRAPT